MATVRGSGNPGVYGESTTGFGVHGFSSDSTGVEARSTRGFALYGESTNNAAIVSFSNKDTAVVGRTNLGVHGFSNENTGVFGQSTTGYGVDGRSNSNAGVHGFSDFGPAVFGEGLHAGQFNGRVEVTGLFTGPDKRFRIDHPSDPQNNYLSHSAVESNKRKNVYDDVAQLDADGTASVDLPEWFEALNGDFRYQLTALGGAAPNLHVAEEVYENRFQIAGGEGGMKVCWQVAGTRKDPWAAANPFEVEEEMTQEERGRYMQPSLYGAPEEQNVMRARISQPRPPPSVEPPPPPAMPPGAPPMPPGVAAPGIGRVEEEYRQQIDELRGQIEEMRRVSVEDEIDELRRQVKKLRRRRRRKR
jgi:hypothetical protein